MEILIVYSEYSKKCKKFIEQLESDSIIDSNKLDKLCIDCPAIRDAIMKQDNVVLKKVPAVLVKSKEMIDVYEGKTAFEWLQTFSDQLYEQLYKQQEEAELLAQQQQEEIEERIRLEAEAIAQEKIQAVQATQTVASSPQTQQKTSIKQQARMIEQDRGQKIVFDDQPKADFGETHVSQVKSDSSNSSRVSDIVKNMEREREIEMANIKKTLSPV
jgi:hypothetical protein